MGWNGVLPIIKPEGFTSFDVVAVVRGIVKQKKIGHTGTLDPMATGVLPLLLGSAAKASVYLPETDKCYEAAFALGYATDTLDRTGTVTQRTDVRITAEQLKVAKAQLTGEILQVPPMYSAVQVKGQRLYDLARQGKEIEREARKVTVHELQLLSFDEQTQTGRFFVHCSKGTYVRSLLDDWAKLCGTLGVLTALCRNTACGFTLKDCCTLEQLKMLCAEGTPESVLHPCESLFTDLPAVQLSPAQSVRFCNGGALFLERLREKNLPDGALTRVNGADGGFLGLGKADAAQGLLLVEKLLCTQRT